MIGKKILAGAMAALLLAACPGLESCAEEGQETPAAEGAEAPQPEKTPEELAAEEKEETVRLFSCFRPHWAAYIRSAIIGIVVGIIPAAGFSTQRRRRNSIFLPASRSF